MRRLQLCQARSATPPITRGTTIATMELVGVVRLVPHQATGRTTIVRVLHGPVKPIPAPLRSNTSGLDAPVVLSS